MAFFKCASQSEHIPTFCFYLFKKVLQLYIDRGTNAHDSGFITTNNNRPFQMATNFQINTLVAGDVVVIAFLRMKITVFYSHNALITASKRFCVSVNLRWKRFEVPTPLKLRFHF